MPSLAALVFCVAITIAVAFQIALACGAPWGHLAMGGKYSGRFPPPMRIAALIQGIVLASFAPLVLIRDQFLHSSWYSFSESAIWVVVVIFGISLVMQLITPSKWERILWSPIVAALLISAWLVASS